MKREAENSNFGEEDDAQGESLDIREYINIKENSGRGYEIQGNRIFCCMVIILLFQKGSKKNADQKVKQIVA